MLSTRNSDEIRAEIKERIYNTIQNENQQLREKLRGEPFFRHYSSTDGTGFHVVRSLS